MLDRETSLYSLDEIYVITGEDGGTSEFEIVSVKDGLIYYTFPDLPEQAPTTISVEEFERNLEKGIIKIKPDELTELNPIWKRYTEHRRKYPRALILVRVGDFYEAYEQDALALRDVFGYTLTSRPIGKERKTMVGFPQHIFEQNIEKLIKTGATVVVSTSDGQTAIYADKTHEPKQPAKSRETDILYSVLDCLGIEDITVEYDGDELIAYDNDNEWRGKEFYHFLIDEAFVFTDDGILGIEGELLADFTELAAWYDITVNDNRTPKEAEQSDSLDDVDPAAIREALAKNGIVDGQVVDENALNNAPFIRQVMTDAENDAPLVLAPPKQRKKRVHFTTLYPEIPAEKRHNFRITDRELGYGTASEKYAANVAAIRLLKEIESEERLATPDEQEILSKYVGWGGLSDCFDEKHSRYAELKSLLEPEEYAAARASSRTAFYTSPVIVEAMYKALEQMGFKNGNLLEMIMQSLIQGYEKLKGTPLQGMLAFAG